MQLRDLPRLALTLNLVSALLASPFAVADPMVQESLDKPTPISAPPIPKSAESSPATSSPASNSQPQSTSTSAAAPTKPSVAPTTTAAPAVKPAADPIPESLRDLEPKPGAAIPHASPRIDETPAVPKAAKPAAQPIVLRGRLEEVGGNGARLPVGIMLNLKTQTAKMDPTVEKQLKGLVASFPTNWQGVWGGPLTVWAAQFDPSAFQFDADEENEYVKIWQKNTAGNVTFNFYQQANKISLEPARIIFPPRNDTPASREMQAQLRNSPFAQLMGNGGNSMLSMLTSSTPVMYLGDLNGRGVTGNELNDRVVKNDIRQLKPGVLEQNIVTQSSERHRTTGAVRKSFSETVLRFTRLNDNQLYVQAASITYGHDGHFLHKVLLYGTVNRGQSYSVPTMPGGLPTMAPGSFPGMNPSGNGGGLDGFGDLNKLMRQLQGF